MRPTTPITAVAQTGPFTYGVTPEGRVFVAAEPVLDRASLADADWTAVGFLARDIVVGQPLTIVVDEFVTTTDPVVAEVDMRTVTGAGSLLTA